MKIVSLTPGAGHYYCGSCLRDHALVKALRALGHDAVMAPMYLPWVVEQPIDSQDEQPIQFGGINLYLQQKSAVFRKTPRWLDALFNQSWLLRQAAKRNGMTRAHDLAELTLSMLAGENGKQAKELDKLIDYLDQLGRPDVVSLSNGLLAGLAGPIKRRLGAMVVCNLQGEDAFLDTFDKVDRRRAWTELGRQARKADVLVAASHYYAQVMRRRLNVADDFVHVVHNGIDLTDLSPPDNVPDPPAIGYLAHLRPAKGLHTLVDAFIELKKQGEHPRVRLLIAGTTTPSDQSYINQQRDKLHLAKLSGDVEWLTNLDASAKRAFLQRLTLLSVPATYGEAFGLYILEALACGVPVVQPRHGAFTELLEATGGGILVEPDDPRALAAGLAQLFNDHVRRNELAQTGRRAVLENFGADHMAKRFLDVRLCLQPQTVQP